METSPSILFNSESLDSGSAERRKAAAVASRAIKNEKNWEQLAVVVQLMEPR